MSSFDDLEVREEQKIFDGVEGQPVLEADRWLLNETLELVTVIPALTVPVVHPRGDTLEFVAHRQLVRRQLPHSYLVASPTAERRSMYQWTVRASPSAKVVRARKPNSFSAREVSRERRGWPSGLDASHVMRPRYPTRSAISSTSSRIEISNPAPTFTGSGLS